MATTIKSSGLDFDTIKENLKNYFAQQSEFADYDFEASGLNNILDVLAYNTHINGLTANFALNEAFLNTAQLRSSVLSHAANLGYYPRSNTCSQAVVNITANTTDTITGSATLPRFSSFSTSIDDVTYTFSTTSETSALNDGSGGFTFKNPDGTSNIVIKEGIQKTKTFLVGNQSDNAVYIIPDTNVDTSTLVVRVFDNVGSQSFTEFADIRNAVNITPTSKVYIVREAPNGFYELIFSEGNVLGQAPVAGNQIVATYLSTKGGTANNASSFTAINKISIGGANYNLTTTKVANSAGGADKESLASIKLNAPTAFAAQQRMVTAEDYKTLIIGRYNNVLDDVIAWGGQDNIPATFGNVYVSLKFKDGIAANIQQETKDSIKSNFAANLSIMSIDTEFVDATETFMEVNVKFDFDPDLSGDTVNSTQIKIKNKVGEFFAANLGLFGRTFRRSALLSELDALSPAVLNSSATVNLQRRISAPTDFTLAKAGPITINFPMVIAKPDDENYIITSTRFTFKGNNSFIRNKLGTTTLQVIDVNSDAVVDDNAGSYTETTGVVKLDDAFNISDYEGTAIKFTAVPDNQSTIKPLRNHILKFDIDASKSDGTVDTQNTPTVL